LIALGTRAPFVLDVFGGLYHAARAVDVFVATIDRAIVRLLASVIHFAHRRRSGWPHPTARRILSTFV
jgi:hypothetical protein